MEVKLIAINDSDWHANHHVFVDGVDVGWAGYYVLPDRTVWLTWRTFPKYRRRGYAEAASREIIQLIRERFPRHQVSALIRPWNMESLALATKLGMVEQHRNERNVIVILPAKEGS